MTTSDRVPGAGEERVSARSWRLLLFLTALNVLNFVDRTLIAGLAPLLIEDLGLSRAEIGLLAGFGFVFFYSLVGLLLGVAADRWRRIPLVAAGVALWSAMTAVSGWARSFVQLAIPRIFVGVGEATLTPSGLSMLGDAFPPRRLAMATGVYYAGIPIGTAVGLLVSGWMAPRWGWRSCFLVLGALGIAAAALLLLVREPQRRQTVPATSVRIGALLRDLATALRSQSELVLTLVAGALLVYGSAAAMLVVTWLVEERGYPYSRAAYTAGLMAVCAGFTGNLAGGAFADACARRRPDGHLWSLIPMTAISMPVTLAFYCMEPGTPLFLVCWFVAVAGGSAYFGPLFASLQRQAPAHTRSTVIALGLLAVNLLGVGPGPLLTGWLGDRHSLTLGLASSQLVVALALVPLLIATRRRPDRPTIG